MNHLRRSILTAATCALACLASARNEDFEIDLQPIFLGLSSVESYPVAVTIFNKGPDARGEIQVGGSVQTSYPVELPRGSRKRIIIYVSESNPYSSDGMVLLDTDRCHIEARAPFQQSDYMEEQAVLLVTQTPGEMGFLRKDTVRSENGSGGDSLPVRGFKDLYIKPGLGPDRASGYRGIATIVLGSGSELLSDIEVAAIKHWILIGGRLVFVGGASNPVLSDPRWQDFLPAKTFTPVTINSSHALSVEGEYPVPGAITVLMPGLGKERADTMSKLHWSRQFGLGEVDYLAFNPFERPLSGWAGRGAAMRKLLKPPSLNSGERVLDVYTNRYGDEYYGGYGTTTAVTTGSSYVMPSPPSRDPFQASLPPTQNIALVLGIYLLVVVPINFLVLRKLRRGELAWITAPAISLAAAGILFSSAGGLYSAKLATNSSGVLVMQDGFGDAYFVGHSQMFFPSGGSMDLKLRGVESLEAGSDRYDFSMRQTQDNLSAVDIGEVQVPALRAANLAFREMYYRQHLTMPQLLKLDISRTSSSTEFTVRNLSANPLTDVRIAAKGRMTMVAGSIGPGESKTVPWTSIGDYQDEYGAAAFTMTSPVAIVFANLSGFRPGPQVGEDYGSVIKLAFCKQLPAVKP